VLLNLIDDSNYLQWNSLSEYLNKFTIQKWTGKSLYRAVLQMYEGAFIYIANCTECVKGYSNL
jgi:DNA-binding ferritin-like protein (Dps family)